MSKISCSACGKIHDRNYICEVKKRIAMEKSNRERNRLDNSIYVSARWRKLRKYILDDYNHICLFSYYVLGMIVEAEEVHHIIWLTDDIDLAYDTDNLICLSHHAHRRIIHKYSNINNKIKEDIKNILNNMLHDWGKCNKTIGSYEHIWNDIIKG